MITTIEGVRSNGVAVVLGGECYVVVVVVVEEKKKNVDVEFLAVMTS